MKAMVLHAVCSLDTQVRPLVASELPVPQPDAHELLIMVSVCGVCHTELDEIEGRTAPKKLPIVLGHQVVGTVAATGQAVSKFRKGDRVGVAWIYSACGTCQFCLSGKENLCPDFKATGRDAHGGYAEYMTVSEDFAYLLPSTLADEQAAPLLCAGAIGYRSLQLTGLQDSQVIGLTGFGASAHLVVQMIKFCFPNSKIFVFARSEKQRGFARTLGADWVGDSQDTPPEPLHAIIDTTPAWKPVLEALRHLQPSGRLVINAIRKEDADKDYLLNCNYPLHLWMEKEIKSVANITRQDVQEFLLLAASIPIKPEIQIYPLAEANRALLDLKKGNIQGAKVLQVQ